MSQTKGTCPVCEKPLTASDDVVFCPECGTPYHRECYLKSGHCMHESEHAAGYIYKPPAKATKSNSSTSVASAKQAYSSTEANATTKEGVICKNCQTANDAKNIFCEKCGFPLNAPNKPSPFENKQTANQMFFSAIDMSGDIDGISKQEWATYIGQSAPIYIARMNSQVQKNSKLSFMISAFFLGPFYFAYRKMWGWASFAFLVSIILVLPTFLQIMIAGGNPLVAGISAGFVAELVYIFNFLTLVFNMLCGIFSLHLFRQTTGKKLMIMKNEAATATDFHANILKESGPSIVGALVFVGLLVLVSSIIGFFCREDLMQYLLQTAQLLDFSVPFLL